MQVHYSPPAMKYGIIALRGMVTYPLKAGHFPPFSQIQVNGDFNVLVTTDTASVAVVEADENLQDLIKTYVSGDKLIIESKNGDCLNSSHTIGISVTHL